MSRREKHTTAPDNQDDNYEAAVLDFLNREIAAAQPVRNQNDQSAELDALVSDLLKQVINESDQQQESKTAMPEDRDSLHSGVTPGQEEVVPSESNLLANLDRGLSQTISEKDLWENESESSPASSEDEGRPEEALPRAAESPAPSPPMTADTKEAGPYINAAEENIRSQLFAPYPEEVFKPVPAQKRKLLVAVMAAIGLLILVGGAIYYFKGSAGSPSKSPSAQSVAPVPVASVSEIQVVPPSAQPDKKAAKQQKAAQPPSKSSVAAGAPKAGTTVAAQKPPPSPKEAPLSAIQQPVNNSKADTEPAAPMLAGDTVAAKPSVEERAASEGPTGATTDAPANGVVSDPAPVIEKASPPAAPTNTAPANSSAEKATAQPEAPPPVKTESSQSGAQPLSAAPAKARVLAPATAISQESPAYPELALRTRTWASIVLELQIDEKGKVTKATPVSGSSMFYDAAVAAAMKWRYKPASIDGVNVPSQARVTMNFNMKK